MNSKIDGFVMQTYAVQSGVTGLVFAAAIFNVINHA